MLVDPLSEPTGRDRARGLAGVPRPLREAVERAWMQLQEGMEELGLRVPAHLDFIDAMFRVWASSEFVAQSCAREPWLLRDLLDRGDLLSDYTPSEFGSRVDRVCAAARDQKGLAAALRHLRRREMVRIVWRDLAGWASLEETLRDLTALADACVQGALERLETWLRDELGVPCAEDGTEQALVVLAMGKQGAGELNMSSDIDLIFAYPEDGWTRGAAPIANEEFFARLGQQLIASLNEKTAEGFVYRVDMRLRPYGESGPLAASFDALEDYYQSQGREWERYAMIKARVVAGDYGAGRRLLALLQPFVYRRYLDFGVFESLRTMKEMIKRQVKRKGMQQNIKLGPGGIREVEFIAQGIQLVRGGREPSLREPATAVVLRRLVELGYLPRFVGERLVEAYRFLRRVENRLQAYADEQVHTLPDDQTERLRLAFAMGYSDWAAFSGDLAEHQRTIQEHFEQVFAAPQAEDEENGKAAADGLIGVWQGSLDTEHAQGLLEQAGFDDSPEALRVLNAFRDGHAYRAMGSRGVEIMDRLGPMILRAVGATAQPEQTLVRVVHLLESVARRTAYLSLLVENPMALSQLVKLCGASPWIAQLLAQHPLLLDELLDPRTLYQPLERAALERELSEALAEVDVSDLEQQMEALRVFKQVNVLRVAAADVARVMPLMVVSDHLTAIAEVCLTHVVRIAWDYLIARHGRPPVGASGEDRETPGFGVIAYGKLGGFELGYGSDLDLVFLHGLDDESEAQTDGPKPLGAGEFFARLGQRIIHMLNTLTPSGVLYEVDLRLRPSGGAGLLVSSVPAFSAYQLEEAWTWEHQALVRARPVAGDPEVGREFVRLRQHVLERKRDPAALRKEVGEMRERMRKELSKDRRERFDLKQGRGGITDIEFLVQYGVLAWCHDYPDVAEYTDNIRQLEALARNGLIEHSQAELLADAYRAYRSRIHELTLQEEEAVVDPDEFADYREAVIDLWRLQIG